MQLTYHCRDACKFLLSYHFIVGLESAADTGFRSDIISKTINTDLHCQNDKEIYILATILALISALFELGESHSQQNSFYTNSKQTNKQKVMYSTQLSDCLN